MYVELASNAPVAPTVDRTISGKPRDAIAVAYAGPYLASDEAAWVRRTNIIVDGGAHAYM